MYKYTCDDKYTSMHWLSAFCPLVVIHEYISNKHRDVLHGTRMQTQKKPRFPHSLPLSVICAVTADNFAASFLT
jgi:hypothetical protein